MAVYLSPGVYPREQDLSSVATAVGQIRPAFIGTAKKGPMNVPVLITGAQQAIETFGEPSSESYLMYAVLAYLEEGNQAYVMRVGVECEDGQDAALDAVCIDVSGARGSGWGRIPLFTGIDYGHINLRLVDADNPIAFHAAAVTGITYNDVDVSVTDGATTATLETTGTYTGAVDDSFILIVTGDPDVSDGALVSGAEYEIIRNSDGEIVAAGTFDDPGAAGLSSYIPVGDGLSVRVRVTAGVLQANDTFSWSVVPDNRKFGIAVEGAAAVEYTFAAATHTTITSFVAAFNALAASEDYAMVAYTLDDGTIIPQIRTDTAGERIQITSTSAWALEVGQDLWAWDIPRSYLLGAAHGDVSITTQNNRVALQVVGTDSTVLIDLSLPVGLNQTVDSIAGSLDVAGVVAGVAYFDSFVLTTTDGTEHVAIVTSVGRQLDTLRLLADYSHLKTLRFVEELGIAFPYKRSYRGFSDGRLTLPASGETDAAIPLACETDPTGAGCLSDTAYFGSIVGWLVATSPGTWIEDYTVSLDVFTEGVGEIAGRYKFTILDADATPVDIIQDVSFDPREDRYIANVLNPGTKHGGRSGNSFVNWEARPAYLGNDTGADDFAVRLPSQFTRKEFGGEADGIPTDAAYSTELDAAVIGNPATSTGMYAFQNPEALDITLLSIPGFSSGAVIGTALQVAQNRGDMLVLVDPPFGLRPQQVVDWHNGMLLSDLNSAINSSYGALYWGWVKIFDQFSSDEIWIPPSGHVAAVYSRTARDAEEWFPPAGLRRGRLLTALDVEYSPSRGEQDLLYGSGNAVNAIVKFPQEGITVFGQRTLQRTQSALDRVSVRMLLIHIKRNLIQILRNFVFEPNDPILRRQVQATVEPFLADIQARRGLQAWKVVVDASNNSPERVDRNELWVTLFLKPTRAVEFVVLNLVTLRTGASFSAQEVLAAGGIVEAATAV